MNRFRFLPVGLVIFLLTFAACKSSLQEEHTYTNALINESSPYLLQHAHNPVNWYPWGEEALAKAQAEDKLLIISVGYAACHWCHVMEHESFEDTTVARIMNENFVSIKVDREERPDVDDVYMTACQLATQDGCGWPLNAIALPDGRPIWAGTYFPRKNWLEVLEYFIEEKAKRGAQMEGYADQLMETIDKLGNLAAVDEVNTFEPENVEAFGTALLAGLDPVKGGRRAIQKFPMPDNFQWLQQYTFFSGNEEAAQVLRNTLDHMAAGGIYDQLRGGFARYSTDPDWLVPHFEKMLYDNAQLVSLYAASYAQFGEERYREVVEETIGFVEAELTAPTSGFYSSLDADSEGEEGKFYVWTTNEIDSLLSADEADLIKDYYQLTKSGNWEKGVNILHYDPTKEPLTGPQRDLLVAAREKLLTAQNKRARPGLDDKMLTAWNALMIKAYADAAAALQKPAYLDKALQAAAFLQSNARREDGGLWRNHKDGKSSINAFLDDYAHTIQAYVRLYELTFNEQWLRNGEELADYVIQHFSNEGSNLFYYTSDLDPPLVSRRTEVQDNVIAGSNSAFAEALWQLGLYLDKEEYTTRSDQMLSAVSATDEFLSAPNFYANWAQLLLRRVYPPYEVAVVGDNWQKVNEELQANYLPNAVFLGGDSEGSLSLLKNKLVEGETFIYVCRNKICKLPVQSAQEALTLMD